jgi:O-antigen ligase
LWWFLGYVGIYALNGFFISEEFVGGFLSRLVTLIQLMVLFWISSSVLEEEGIARRILLAYSLGSVFLAIGFILNLPGFAPMDIGKGRSTALGEDPNNLAVLMAIASVILIGLCLSRTSNRFIDKFLLPSMLLPLFVLMVHTGSRSGLLSFVIGCMVYLVLIWRSKQKLTAAVLATLAIAAISYMAFSEDSFAERWQQAYFERNLAGRENISSAAIEMFFERPVFGWKPVELWYELAFRLGERNTKDTHNLLLHLLLEVGLVGTIPFLIGLALCCRAAYRARTGYLGVLPLALLLTTLTANLALTHLERKPFWIVLALCIAAASPESKRQRKLSRMPLAAHAFRKRI